MPPITRSRKVSVLAFADFADVHLDALAGNRTAVSLAPLAIKLRAAQPVFAVPDQHGVDGAERQLQAMEP